MEVDRNSALWRECGAKALIEYLSSAVDEEHDAAVYDTGYEFDRFDPDAVRFIACIAMTKASATKDGEVFSYMPERPNRVVPLADATSCEQTRALSQERAEREAAARYTYIPDQTKYVKYVIDAITYRNIARQDMTPEEKEADDKKQTKIDKANRRYDIFHVYLPLVLCGIFAVIGLIGLLRGCVAAFTA